MLHISENFQNVISKDMDVVASEWTTQQQTYESLKTV